MARILSICYNQAVLYTRELLLRREGYEVESAHSYSSAIYACQHGAFDLVILGNSIPQGDKQHIISMIRTVSSTPVLSLCLPHAGPLKSADYNLNTCDPDIFLETVREGLRGGTPTNPMHQ
jgi:CheY-like chemotaxis protein